MWNNDPYYYSWWAWTVDRSEVDSVDDLKKLSAQTWMSLEEARIALEEWAYFKSINWPFQICENTLPWLNWLNYSNIPTKVLSILNLSFEKLHAEEESTILTKSALLYEYSEDDDKDIIEIYIKASKSIQIEILREALKNYFPWFHKLNRYKSSKSKVELDNKTEISSFIDILNKWIVKWSNVRDNAGRTFEVLWISQNCKLILNTNPVKINSPIWYELIY